MNVPEVGDLTLVLNPNQTNRLVILWHGNIYWTSEPWNNSQFKLPYSSNDFSYVSNENETYFNYSVGKDITTTPRLLIDYLGTLNDSSGALVSCSHPTYSPIYYGMTDGCAVQKLPECRGPGSNLYILPSIFMGNSSNGFEFNESDNLTIVDCQAKCLNNCSCIAYASTKEDGDAGCEIWSTLPLPEGAYLINSVGRTIYNIKSPSKSTSYPIYHINLYN